MTKNLPKKLNLQLSLLIISILILVIFFFITVYFLFIKDTFKSYSIVQSWKEYYSMEDWNLPKHAITDLDNDGEKDIITFTFPYCAFLSSVKAENIPPNKQCKEPGMSTIAFPDNTTSVGQKLSPQKPFQYRWLGKSYLVKTQEDIWKLYDMKGLQLRIYELGKNHLFTEVEPTLLDRIDVLTYQISHLGVILFITIMSPLAGVGF